MSQPNFQWQPSAHPPQQDDYTFGPDDDGTFGWPVAIHHSSQPEVAAVSGPSAPATGGPYASTPRPKPTMWMATTAIFGVLAIGFAVLWASTPPQGSRSTTATFAVASEPNLLALTETYLPNALYLDGDQDYVSFTLMTVDDATHAGLKQLLGHLGFNAGGVVSQMGQTRALDGTLTADGDHMKASWTYHPDDGLQIIIQETPTR